MKEFEHLGPDGRVYLHYDNWLRWRANRLCEYPGCDGWDDKWRIDLEIAHPRSNILDVPIERNPHAATFGPRACFYLCDNWSVIFGVHDAHRENTESHRMLIESCNPRPTWGEQIILASTSSTICPEPWGMNVPNVFAKFRNRWWRVTWCELLHQWPAGRVFYPLTNYRRGEFRSIDPYIGDDVFIRNDRFMNFINLTNNLELEILLTRVFSFDSLGDRTEPALCNVDWRETGF